MKIKFVIGSFLMSSALVAIIGCDNRATTDSSVLDWPLPNRPLPLPTPPNGPIFIRNSNVIATSLVYSNDVLHGEPVQVALVAVKNIGNIATGRPRVETQCVGDHSVNCRYNVGLKFNGSLETSYMFVKEDGSVLQPGQTIELLAFWTTPNVFNHCDKVVVEIDPKRLMGQMGLKVYLDDTTTLVAHEKNNSVACPL